MVTVELGNIIAVRYIPFFFYLSIFLRFIISVSCFSVICLRTVFCTHIVDEFVANVFTTML